MTAVKSDKIQACSFIYFYFFVTKKLFLSRLLGDGSFGWRCWVLHKNQTFLLSLSVSSLVLHHVWPWRWLYLTVSLHVCAFKNSQSSEKVEKAPLYKCQVFVFNPAGSMDDGWSSTAGAHSRKRRHLFQSWTEKPGVVTEIVKKLRYFQTVSPGGHSHSGAPLFAWKPKAVAELVETSSNWINLPNGWSAAAVQFLRRYNRWCHNEPLGADEAEMKSAGSLVLIHVKWREEARGERTGMKETVMNKDWRRLVWACADLQILYFTPFSSLNYLYTSTDSILSLSAQSLI